MAPFLCRFLSLVLAMGMATVLEGRAVSQEYEVIDNSPFEIEGDTLRASLVAIRPLTSADYTSAGNLPQLRLTKDLIASAAAEFEEIRSVLAQRNITPQEVELHEWDEIIEESGYKDVYLFRYDDPDPHHETKSRVVMSEFATSPAYKMWDATSLTNMLATGIIDTTNVEIVNVDGNQIETVRLDEVYASRMREIYLRKPLVENQSPPYAGFQLSNLQLDIREYDSLAQSFLLWVGDITFGEPIIWTADEKKLELPNSVKRRYDVYWIELRATFRELEANISMNLR